MTIEDCEAVGEIERRNFSVPWTVDDFEGSIVQDNYRLYVCVSDDDEIIGYSSFYFVVDEAEIVNIFVREDYRKSGIGKALIEKMIEEARNQNVKNMFLEVRKSNEPAKGLYKKCGFSDVSIRKGFYEKPTEDAIVMRIMI